MTQAAMTRTSVMTVNASLFMSSRSNSIGLPADRKDGLVHQIISTMPDTMKAMPGHSRPLTSRSAPARKKKHRSLYYNYVYNIEMSRAQFLLGYQSYYFGKTSCI